MECYFGTVKGAEQMTNEQWRDKGICPFDARY